MTGKQISVWMLVGCLTAGATWGVSAGAQQPEEDAQFYEEGQPEYAPDGDPALEQETWQEGESYREGYASDAAQSDTAAQAEEGQAQQEDEQSESYSGDYIYIRNSDAEVSIEDFDVLTKEDAENAFDLMDSTQIPLYTYLDVPELLQKPELPTGCESVSLTMALEYEGFELDKTTIAREFLIYNRETDNMAIGYIGDPFSEDGAGCFAPALAATADHFFTDQGYDYVAYNISGTEMEDLLSYVAAGTPVILWSTMYMASPEFTDEVAEYQGTLYRWYRQEHCVVLTGYDLESQTLQINDPLEGIVTRDFTEFRDIYDAIGRYAIVLKEQTGANDATGEFSTQSVQTEGFSAAGTGVTQ